MQPALGHLRAKVIAVSSYRPFGRFPDIDRNQMVAKQSWDAVFDGVVYLNPFCVQLWSELTHFTGETGRPKMRELFLIAAMSGDLGAVVNSDIVIGPGMRDLISHRFAGGLACAYSFRYEFDPDRPNWQSAKQVDPGLDFFVAHPAIWFRTVKDCPDKFIIGNGEWDSWLLYYWEKKYGRLCANLTSHKLVFHPRHGNREREPDAVMV